MGNKSESTALTRTRIIAELTRSSHGKLEEYVPTGRQAVYQEPEFFAHLIAWNLKNGQVRDSQVALPILSLADPNFDDPEFVSNSLAVLTKLNPRELLKAFRFAKFFGKAESTSGPCHRMLTLRRLVQRYLRNLEDQTTTWDRVALQHRAVLKELYALSHTKPNPHAKRILFDRDFPEGSLFYLVRELSKMSIEDAAATIVEKKIPFLVARGALGAKAKNPDVVLALIKRMTPTELIASSKMLNNLGVQKDPKLRAAYEEALTKARSSKKTTFKATRAAEAVEDEGLKKKLSELQEKQSETLGKIEGNWLVLGDCSGSMTQSIDVATEVAGILAHMVKDKVHLVFFNNGPTYFNATGLTLEQLREKVRRVRASGGTSIGCGVQYVRESHFDVDGIAVVSDGGENGAPYFAETYTKLCAELGKDVPIYFYRVSGDTDCLSDNLKQAKLDFQKFDLSGAQVDYYSLPNLIKTMRTNRYSFVDEIMNTPLLTLDKAYDGIVRGVTQQLSA